MPHCTACPHATRIQIGLEVYYDCARAEALVAGMTLGPVVEEEPDAEELDVLEVAA